MHEIVPRDPTWHARVQGIDVRMPANLPAKIRNEVLEFVTSSTIEVVRKVGAVTNVVIEVVLDVNAQAQMTAAYYSNYTRVFIQEVAPVVGRLAAYDRGLRAVRGMDPELAAIGEAQLRRNFVK